MTDHFQIPALHTVASSLEAASAADAAPLDEAARLAILRAVSAADAPLDAALGSLTQLAAQLCAAPVAWLVLVDDKKQIIRASFGWDGALEAPRAASLGDFTLREWQTHGSEFTQVRDVAAHEMTAPLQFFAGAPLVVQGAALGALCVLDAAPRELTAEQSGALRALAQQVAALLAQRLALSVAQNSEGEIKALFAAFMENTAALAFAKDAGGRLIFVNAAYETRFNCRSEAVVGRSDDALWSPEVAKQLRRHDDEVLRTNRVIKVKESLTLPDGTQRHYIMRKFPMTLGAGRCVGTLAYDVTEQHQQDAELRTAQARLDKLNDRDALTGILNRRGLSEHIEKELQRAVRYQRPLSLLLINVDDFKLFNDIFGHETGDELLVNIAKLLQGKTRDTDILGRDSGGVFMILLPETPHTGAVAFAERCRTAVSAAAWINQRVTVSIGVATAGEEGREGHSKIIDADSLLSEADLRLYQSQKRGRSQITHALKG